MKTKFSKFQKTNYFAYLILSLAAVLYILGIQTIMQVAHVLSSELDAVPLVITLLLPDLTPFYGLLYLAVNLPIILLFFKKVRRKFMVRTIYFLLVSTAFSTIFFIPGAEHALQNLIVESDKVITDTKWAMFVLPALGGTIVGTAIALSWKYGGSTGGADVIVYYFSTKKKKEVGSTLFIVSLIIMVSAFAVLIGIKKEVREVWLPAMFGSLIYIIVLSMIINLIFPKYQKVQIEIHSGKISEITTFLKAHHGHPFRIEEATSGYLNKEMKYITTVILILEQKDFSKAIKEIDPQAWIAAIPVSNVFGRFNTKSVDGN